MLVGRLRVLDSAFIGLIVGILVIVASAGPATAEVRASSADTAGVLDFTYDEPAVRAAQGIGKTGAVVTIGGSDPASSMRTIRLAGVVDDSPRLLVPPRALPAARQVDATWGPAHQYTHGPGPMTAIEHINYRHAFDSGFDNVSRFADGTSAGQIQGYVDEALRYGDGQFQ